jgi:hypothetical protein
LAEKALQSYKFLCSKDGLREKENIESEEGRFIPAGVGCSGLKLE